MSQNALPQVAVVATHALAERVRGLLPQYAGRCVMGLLEKSSDEALPSLQQMAKQGELDVVVAAGQGAQRLREALNLPVASIAVSSYDILHALGDAQPVAERVVVLSRQALHASFNRLAPLLQRAPEHICYREQADALLILEQLAKQGQVVVLGSSLVVQWAKQVGLPAVLLYSPEAIAQALDGALEMVRMARLEVAKRERLDHILASLSEGVVAVDEQERVETLNPALARLLGLAPGWAHGRRWSEIAPSLSLREVLKSGEAYRDEVASVVGRSVVTQRLPLFEAGVQVGAVLSLQDASSINRVERKLRARAQHGQFRARYSLHDLLGNCPSMRTVRQLAERYAASDAAVLILGESGTGKELFAQGMHRASTRSEGPFVALNCAAFPESLLESELFGYEEGAFSGSRKGGKRGLIELADRGTLFLDEIGDMPLSLQTRLLRVLQEREVLRVGGGEPVPVDIRVIAATHQVLREAVDKRLFRLDLYYRLAILTLQLPRLAERGEDICLIAEHLAAEVLRRNRQAFTPEQLVAPLLQAAAGYAWPGNVRELQNLIERLAILCEVEGLPSAALVRSLMPELQGSLPPALTEPDRSAQARAVLQACQGDRQQAAHQLGISRTTLWRLLRNG